MSEMNDYEDGWSNDALVASTATKDDIERYCYGECHAFAIGLSRITGWRIHLVLDHAEPYWVNDNDEEDTIPSVVHVLCDDGNGNFWDVRGSRPYDGLQEEMMGWHAIMGYGSDAGCSEAELKHYMGYWGEEGEEEIDRPLHDLTDEDLLEAEDAVRRVLGAVPGYASTVAAPSR